MKDAWPIVISTSLTLVGIVIAYIQWRRDVQLKLESIHDTITAELVKQRVGPYNEFIKQLEQMSTVHKDAITANPEMAIGFSTIFQEAVYGPTGLLASYDTREFIVHARRMCMQFANGKTDYETLQKCFWAVHVGLRSDLGIAQPNWPNEIERIRKRIIAQDREAIESQALKVPHIFEDEK